MNNTTKRITLMDGLGRGGMTLEEKEWAVYTLKDIGPVKLRNIRERDLQNLFPGQLLFGITDAGQLIGIDVAQDGSLIPRNSS